MSVTSLPQRVRHERTQIAEVKALQRRSKSFVSSRKCKSRRYRSPHTYEILNIDVFPTCKHQLHLPTVSLGHDSE